MERAEIERSLREAAGVVVVDPRTLRRVIKHHRDIVGVVPHDRCYAIERGALVEALGGDDLGGIVPDLPPEVVLVARPSSREAARGRVEVLTRLWRAAFHARVHRVLEIRSAAGHLDEAIVRRRIETIGSIEFDEIRSILRHDDLSLPPGDDREVYIEFCALYLELVHFAPRLLVTTFPGLVDHERVAQAIREDVDPGPLLERGRPPEVVLDRGGGPTAGTSLGPTFSALPTMGPHAGDEPRPPISLGAHERCLRRAAIERARGNDVRAALLALQAAAIEDIDRRKAAEAAARDALQSLCARLTAALAPPSRPAPETEARSSDATAPGAPSQEKPPAAAAPVEGSAAPDMSALLFLLGDRATAERASKYAVEGRILYMLQRAVVAFERPRRAVDLATSILSRGKRPVVRDLPATRELRVARDIAAAARRVRNVRLGGGDRKLLQRTLQWAVARSEQNVRTVLKHRIDGAFTEVGLVPKSGAERLARDKVAEELIDRALDRGFLSFDTLRDAISRNQLKLDDLDGLRELRDGDPLLKADRALSIALDGIYRRGDIYLRGLQKVSSIPFGTRVGRWLTLTLVLPLGASYVLLYFVDHGIWPLLEWFGLSRRSTALNPTSFVVLALLVLALVHSRAFRVFAREVLELVGVLLAWAFLRLPRAVFDAPIVRRVLAHPPVRWTLRRVVLPAAIGGLVYLFGPFASAAWWAPLAFAGGVFAVSSLVMSSRLGAVLEDFVVDQLAPTWQYVSRQWLPGLFRLIGRFFTTAMEMLERGIYRVDEALRYRDGESVLKLVLKGVGVFVFGIVAYVVRFYVTLLIEPEINPLKHFPVVTVAHKIMLPYTVVLLEIVQAPLSPLGPFISNTLAGVTVFLIPSVFGFLAWELKENYKLYRATRPDEMPAANVGPHGETVRGLLVPGFHSGTLPKLYERLRRAAQREDEASVLRKDRKPRGGGGLNRFREGLSDVERGVARFFDRELLRLLHRCPRWPHGPLDLDGIELSSNRIRVRVRCPALSKAPCEITLEEQSGFLVAGMPRPGFVARLTPGDGGRRLFENALAGLYQLAQVDFVREQLEAELGDAINYDIADAGLLVWPDDDYRIELLYPLGEADGGAPIAPLVRGIEPEVPPRVLDPRRMFYRDQNISWLAWVAAWSASAHAQADIPRLLRGVSILPAGARLTPVPTNPSSRPGGQTRYEQTIRLSDPPATPRTVRLG
ncbi:MAG: hypothetical protein AAF715_10690 [Myxococcota bacterium]